MTGHHFLAEEIDYGRKLVQAGIQGLESGVAKPTVMPELAVAAKSSFKAAAIGAGLAWMSCQILNRRAERGRTVMACSVLAFCAELGWRTRTLRSQLLNGAAKEISKVRDQHWLEMNPIDYA